LQGRSRCWYLEGETEEIFYPLVAARYLVGIPLHYKLLRGQGNINRQVTGAAGQYLHNNPATRVRVYCCIDAERNKRSATPLELDFVREEIVRRNLRGVLSVDAIMADPEIESWFFHDVEGVYGFVQAKKSRRNPGRYRNASNFGKRDLQRLFEQFGKVYVSGKRARHFIESLDVERIVKCCPGLCAGVTLIRTQAHDMTNHLIR